MVPRRRSSPAASAIVDGQGRHVPFDVAYPYERDFDGDGSPDARAVLPDYVDDHPLEPLARLTAGRDLGWPYCNPDPDVDPRLAAQNHGYRLAATGLVLRNGVVERVR